MEQDGEKLTAIYKKNLNSAVLPKFYSYAFITKPTNQPTNQPKADLKVKQTNKKKYRAWSGVFFFFFEWYF